MSSPVPSPSTQLARFNVVSDLDDSETEENAKSTKETLSDEPLETIRPPPTFRDQGTQMKRRKKKESHPKSNLEKELEEKEARRYMFSRVGIRKKRITYKTDQGQKKKRFIIAKRPIDNKTYRETYNYIPFAAFSRILRFYIDEYLHSQGFTIQLRIQRKAILSLRDYISAHMMEHLAAGLYMSQHCQKRVVKEKDISTPLELCTLYTSPLADKFHRFERPNYSGRKRD